MEEHETYIFVAALRSLGGYSGNTHSAFSPTELADLIGQRYQVEFSIRDVQRVFEAATEIVDASDILEHIKSKYASERFIFKTGMLREVARHGGVEALWDRVQKIGDAWLGESLANIKDQLQGTQQSNSDSQPIETKSVPASNRYVSTLDNQDTFEDVKSDLQVIRKEIEASNSIDDEDRLIALSEVALFESAICQPRLAQDIIERFLGFCASKLANWVSGATVGYIIDKLKLLLDMFLSSITSTP